MLRSAVSDYIDRIVDGRELHQRVITQPRPEADIGYLTILPAARITVHGGAIFRLIDSKLYR